MVVIVIQNHCNGEYPEEVITMFDYDFPSEYYWASECKLEVMVVGAGALRSTNELEATES